MKRHAIFVDAGYVFAQGSVSISGSNSQRTQLKLDEAEIVRQLKFLALRQSPGVPLLRVYWYDGARNGPTLDHLALANMQDVKLRLGSINSVGEQKEVDSLLVTDLIDLARNQSICDATLVTADTDVRIAVLIAQSFGVRVHLIGLEPSRVSQSQSLRQEVDTVHEISKADVARFLKISLPISPKIKLDECSATPLAAVRSAGPPHEATSRTGIEADRTLEQILGDAIQRTLVSANSDDILRLCAALEISRDIPQEYDRRLLGTCRALLGRNLTGDERREMRSGFIRHACTARTDSKLESRSQ
ncbi:MAG: NYN domain-containing protein [Acidobacteriaceae bacterium]